MIENSHWFIQFFIETNEKYEWSGQSWFVEILQQQKIRNDMEFERQWLANKHTFKDQNNINSSYFALKHSFLKAVLLAIPRKNRRAQEVWLVENFFERKPQEFL